MKKKKRKVIRITLDELENNFDKYLEQSKNTDIEVIKKNEIVLFYDEVSYKRYKALKALRAMYPNGLKIDPSDIR